MAVATMTVGETSLFTIKPEYAYGEEGSGNKIPPNATLQFNITLVEWKGEDVTRDGQVTKIVLEKGEGYDSPNTGALCEGQIFLYPTGLSVGDIVASWLVHSSPDQAVLGKILYSHSASLHPGVYCKWVQANSMLEVTLQWTSIPSRGEEKHS